MNKLLILCSVVLLTTLCNAQTSTISGQIQDPNGQTFNNGTCSIQFVPTPGATGPFLLNGSTFNQQPPCAFDGSGNISATVSRNDQITPSGSKWQFIVNPNATSQGTTINIIIASPTANITSIVNAVVPVIQVVAGNNVPRAYSDTEVIVTPSPGQAYWNVTANSLKIWNGSTWTQPVNSGTTVSPPWNVTSGGLGTSTSPTNAQIPVGNAGGTAYAPQTFSGDIGITNAGVTTVNKIQGTTVSSTTGSGAVVFGNSPSITTPNISTPNLTGTTAATLGAGSAIAENTSSSGQLKLTFQDDGTGFSRTITLPFPTANRTINYTSGTYQYQFGCSGTATASSTLFLASPGAGFGACTSTTAPLGNGSGEIAAVAGVIGNLTVVCGTAGVNASSGAFTVMAGNPPANTSITCTVGTSFSCQDVTHTQSISAMNALIIKFTTQGGETLANCGASLTQM